MNIEEKVEVLNNIQRSVTLCHKLTDYERVLWLDTVHAIKNAGYVLKKKREMGASHAIVTWYATLPRQRHFTAEFVRISMRPDDGDSTCKGDCTTRAMAYCLKGAASYREIEQEQYRIAEEENRKHGYKWGDGKYKFHRNTNGVWDKVILDFGYVWIKFKKEVRRDNLAKMLSEATHPIISESSTHVAVIENGNVIDTWDSRHGRCMGILVDSNDLRMVKEIMGDNIR